MDRLIHRFTHHPVHHLAIAETLDEQPAEQAFLLAFLHQKRGKCAEPIDREEKGVVKQNLIQISRRMSVFLLMFEIADQRSDEGPDKHQIHDRRDQRKKDLKDPNVWHRDKAERAVTRVEQRVLVLPHALQSAVRPAETLLGEISETVRSLRQTYCAFLVSDIVSEFSHLDGQVLILGKRVGRESTDFNKHRPPPGTHRTGDDRYAVKRGKCPAVEILRRHVFERLPFGDNVDPVADLCITRDRPDPLIGKPVSKSGYCLRSKERVRVESDYHVTRCLSPAKIEGFGLAAIFLFEDRHARLICKSFARDLIRIVS